MFTTGQLIGLGALVIIILLVAVVLQRLNGAIMDSRIEHENATRAEAEQKAAKSAEPQRPSVAPRTQSKRRHGR